MAGRMHRAWDNGDRILCDYCNDISEQAKLSVDMPVGFPLPISIITGKAKCQECGKPLPPVEKK